MNTKTAVKSLKRYIVKSVRTHLSLIALFSLSSVLCPLSSVLAQGSLTPPGAPAPTFKTLQQVEPRTDLATLSGDSFNQYIITQPGSYYLSANINGVSGKSGISVRADNVTIDLNGFALIGVPGSSAGISGFSGEKNLRLHNGTIRSWGSTGVSASSTFTHSSFENLRVYGNGAAGIAVGDNNTVRNCSSHANTGTGIFLGNGGVMTNCIATSNSTGILVLDNCLISNCSEVRPAERRNFFRKRFAIPGGIL